jgi:hypothetical protein
MWPDDNSVTVGSGRNSSSIIIGPRKMHGIKQSLFTLQKRVSAEIIGAGF